MSEQSSGRHGLSAERLPIKLILPHQGTERKVPGGGAPPRPFRDVTPEYRRRISNQIRNVGTAILPATRNTGAAPVRVKLLKRALAKSHRPETLFSEHTCPIIGAGQLGELFLRGTSDGLAKIEAVAERDKSALVVKELSSIESIEPVTPEFRLGGQSPADILRHSPRKDDGFLTRVQLFDFGPTRGQERLVNDFESSCKARNLRVSRGGYSENLAAFEVTCREVTDVEALSRIVGVRSIARMPIVRGIRRQVLNELTIPESLPAPKAPIRDYPVVVVVDSGISDKFQALNKWIIGKESTVAPQYRNPEHGTFVGGLICWAREFNPDLPGLDSSPCAVFDLQVIPNWDPAVGDVEFITESELLQALESALKEHANEFRVWNLSIGLDEVCSLERFSTFAVELDNLQEKYKVSFVISAGNYDSIPLLSFPRTAEQLDRGRITSPADSVLGITVGSISHFSHENGGPRLNEPSAFSRHGAGPNYIIKPDLVHYGGTCRIDGSERRGIRSISSEHSSESVGTSFAAPLVARLLANVNYQVTPTPSPVLARAMLTHHSRDPRTGGRVQDDDENILGFGLPSPLPYCLECTPYTCTLVFEDTLRPGYFLEWDDFPYPESLKRGGRYYGDIWMTVAFSPKRGPQWGTEYCETHITASFGVFYTPKSQKPGKLSTQFRGLVPPEHNHPRILYESYQISKLRKWAPVRTYFGSLGESGRRGDRWRLLVKLLLRHEDEGEAVFKSQPFALILTIADPQKTAPVYDEMARKIHNRYEAQNLMLRAPIQIQVQQ